VSWCPLSFGKVFGDGLWVPKVLYLSLRVEDGLSTVVQPALEEHG